MYHAESLTNIIEQISLGPEHISDNLIWEYLYGIEITFILGYRYTL